MGNVGLVDLGQCGGAPAGLYEDLMRWRVMRDAHYPLHVDYGSSGRDAGVRFYRRPGDPSGECRFKYDRKTSTRVVADASMKSSAGLN
jgi:hypothetical protein